MSFSLLCDGNTQEGENQETKAVVFLDITLSNRRDTIDGYSELSAFLRISYV